MQAALGWDTQLHWTATTARPIASAAVSSISFGYPPFRSSGAALSIAFVTASPGGILSRKTDGWELNHDELRFRPTA